MKNKTIFIAAFQTFVSRNILNTGVLDELIRRGAKVILFVPSVKEDFYKREYSQQNVVVESFDPGKFVGRKEVLIQSVALLLISSNVMVFRKIKMFQKSGNFIKYVYQRGVTALFGKSSSIKRCFRFMDEWFSTADAYGSYFAKYTPDVVFAPDVFGIGDVLLLKSAKKYGVKTVGMVASWDNNTTKGLMRVIPDTLLVQNEIIKDESIHIQAVPEQIISTVGIAHYDYYKSYVPASREEFFDRLGISPEKRLIVFSPAGDKFISTDWQICELLKRAYAKKEIPEDVVVLVRTHPTNPVNLSKFVPDEHFKIEVPGVAFAGAGDKRKELDKEAMHHLIDTITHSELVINVLSSLVIDAAVLDKPVVTIGFEGWEKQVPFGSSVKRYHSDENMAKLLVIGGTKIVKNERELIEAINAYLAHPELDKEGRERIVSKQCFRLDGKAKERIADILIS